WTWRGCDVRPRCFSPPRPWRSCPWCGWTAGASGRGARDRSRARCRRATASRSVPRSPARALQGRGKPVSGGGREARPGGGGRPMTLREQLFATKPVHVLLAETEGDHGLRKVLGPVSLTALGVGAIIGAGIFVLTGLAANQYAGPALALSFVVSGTRFALAALC